jgi:hypothetical protein
MHMQGFSVHCDNHTRSSQQPCMVAQWATLGSHTCGLWHTCTVSWLASRDSHAGSSCTWFCAHRHFSPSSPWGRWKSCLWKSCPRGQKSCLQKGEVLPLEGRVSSPEECSGPLLAQDPWDAQSRSAGPPGLWPLGTISSSSPWAYMWHGP